MRKIAPPEPTKELTPAYQPKALEVAAANAYFAEHKKRAARPRMVVLRNGNRLSVRPDHPDLAVAQILLSQAIGTTDAAFYSGLLTQLANASGVGATPDSEKLNFLLAVIDGISPRDQMEAMLAAQMAVVHSAIMTFARRLAHVENVPQQDSAERTFNKLARTFAGQMETLKRYRSGGEQKVTVQHVHVNGGGQAIVGNVIPGGGATENPTPAP